MKLIIMRHGEAESFGLKDRARCLTPNGIKQANVAGSWLSQYLGEERSIDLAMVSSFFRAEQTYQELAKEVHCLKKQISDDIIPDGNPQLAHDYVRTLFEQENTLETILLVSHMPFVSYFLEQATINKYAMLFDTSSIVVVDYELEESGGLVETIYHPN